MTDKVISIHHLVIHTLIKERNEATTLDLNKEENPIDESAIKLISDVTERYSGRAGKGYGKFEDNFDNYPMSTFVKDYYDLSEQNFYQTSCRMMEHLKARIEDENMATGGTVMISHIDIDKNEYLLVTVLNSTDGIGEKDNKLYPSKYLDISKLSVAGRIDLTAWKAGAERYISFIKGQKDVSAYFKRFLGCNDVLMAKQETEVLTKALKDFAKDVGLDNENRDNFLNKAHDQLYELNKNQEPFSLESFANELWPSDPDVLKTKLADLELGLSDGFIPDGRVIRNLVSFKGKSKFWDLKFQREAIQAGVVCYDFENDVIILKEIPENLKRELQEEQQGDETDV